MSERSGFSYKSHRQPPPLHKQHKGFNSLAEAVWGWLTALNVDLTETQRSSLCFNELHRQDEDKDDELPLWTRHSYMWKTKTINKPLTNRLQKQETGNMKRERCLRTWLSRGQLISELSWSYRGTNGRSFSAGIFSGRQETTPNWTRFSTRPIVPELSDGWSPQHRTLADWSDARSPRPDKQTTPVFKYSHFLVLAHSVTATERFQDLPKKMVRVFSPGCSNKCFYYQRRKTTTRRLLEWFPWPMEKSKVPVFSSKRRMKMFGAVAVKKGLKVIRLKKGSLCLSKLKISRTQRNKRRKGLR